MRAHWLLVFCLAACAKPGPSAPSGPVKLAFAFMNDFHGGLYEHPVKDDPALAIGGLPWLVGAISALRADDPDLVVLDGGDLFEGSWPVNQSNGMGSVQAYNLMKVDAAAVGNHEFDYGGGADHRSWLDAAAGAARFRWLSANIHQGDRVWAPQGIAPTAMIERKGIRIGIIGLTTTATPTTTTPANVADLTFSDPVDTVRALAPLLRNQGARIIAVVGHLSGSCAERAPSWNAAPAPCLPDGEIGRLLTELPRGTIDILAAGHAHTMLAERWDDTFVFEDRAEGTFIGRLDLVVGPGGIDRDASVVHPPWPMTHAPVDPRCEPGDYDLTARDLGGRTVTPSADALALVQSLESSAGSLCQEVGCSTAALGRSREAESGTGDLVADAMLAAFPDADVAVQNSGGLRADLPAGKLRRQDLQAVMPFPNKVLEIELSGARLAEAFRIGASGAHGILQPAGARFRYDPSRTGGSDLDGDGQVADWETDKLCWAEVGGARIDPKKTYKVVTTDFILGGGDNLGPPFAGAKVIAEGKLLREVLFEQVAAHTGCIPVLPDPAAPRVERGPCL
jgi:5'-nucleotidase